MSKAEYCVTCTQFLNDHLPYPECSDFCPKRLVDYHEVVKQVAQLCKDTMAGKLVSCPKCHRVAVFWNAKGESGESCWECVACNTVYPTEYSLIVAECDAIRQKSVRSVNNLAATKYDGNQYNSGLG